MEGQRPFAKRTTRLRDLAQLAEVSIATVSRALNDSPAVNEETKRRVWRLAREYNYAFRPHMPALLSGAAATLAVVIPIPQGRQPRISDPFYLELLGGIADAARDGGFDIIISHVSPKSYDELEHLMDSARADGMIFLGQSFLHEHFNRLAKARKRFVVWGAELPGQLYCSVGSDNLRGGRRATAHLIRLGRKRIAFFGDREAIEMLQRYEGYLEALKEAGISHDPALVAPAHFEIESAEAAVNKMLMSGVSFDAVFAANDLIGFGAIRALGRAGIKVPEDVSIIGYDDVQLARYSSPSLTTISQDMQKAGRLLVSRLLSASDERAMPPTRLPTDLIVRESCGA